MIGAQASSNGSGLRARGCQAGGTGGHPERMGDVREGDGRHMVYVGRVSAREKGRQVCVTFR